MKRLISLVLATLLLFSGCAASPVETPEPPEEDPPASAEPAKIKVMSWNILNPTWGGLPADMRIDAFTETVKAQAPDILGLQEASTAWHTEFTAMPSSYKPLCDTTKSGKDCMTMFFYNADTLTVVESGIEDLDDGSNIRVVSWAVLEAENGNRFLITNTHPDSREAECKKHTEQYLGIARRLYEEKRLPLISVGDFNAIETSDAYALSIDDSYTDSKYADGVELIKDYDSYLLGDYGGKVTRGKGSRDHIFFKGTVTPLTFETIYNKTVATVSDHLPVVAELEIA